ncbi:hypothetical protein TWF106_008673 [Orbilia oligospora]|uniref:O-methyltransferase C-terminal domain-containing protein n=1 Tax=Orbilia oligospora TaxID=2813651 RepID=A0A6G1M5U6_ORBOL|nr:hypothetical protein TWF788_006780 [Orbilia oligospora]KAF3203054.1 hypothetical protein TWF679_010520 [Orbilia oligospora]KAF3215666.1 hypothetical protein TWF106_008673 [Orbilia oligospora]KAF3227216.1 hypothetical protein TWF191_004083 [Orbilia oligospora]KAF3246874.1 hypothetical protein TWF192_006689 [Orbilia oligospora]
MVHTAQDSAAGPAPILRPKLSELAAQIAENAKILEDYIESQGLPYPSFAADGPAKFPLPPVGSTPEVEKLHAARLQVLEASKSMLDLTAGPSEMLQWLVWGFNDTSTIHVIHHFKIAQHVPETGDISFTELSEKINVSSLKLRQILRYAMTNRIFCEPRQGYIGHTALSLLLRDEDSPEWAWIGYNTEELCRTGPALVPCLEKYPHSQELNETPWSVAHKDQGFFEYMDENPESAKRFGVCMSLWSSGDGLKVAPLVTGYDWGKLPEGATVVDVGGATGFVSLEIAKANPSLKFIIEDIAPLSLEQGKKNLARDHPDLVERFEFRQHDFMTEQPVKGADAYLVRFILHDWPDKYVHQILKSLIPAFKNGTKLIVSDFVIPPANVLPPREERTVRALDLVIFKAYNSNEREEADWRRLFAEVDTRLRVDSITRPANSLLWVLELTFVDE